MTFNTNLDQTCKTDKIFLLDQRMKWKEISTQLKYVKYESINEFID